MRKIIVSTFASLDGVIDAPEESAYLPFHDADVEAHSYELLASSDALLLGRKTYQELAHSWRRRTSEFAKRMNEIQKYVASMTLERADEWENSTLLTGDIPEQVEKLKQAPGKTILIYGCGKLARTLNDHGLIDEFEIFYAPIVVGRGTHLFADPEKPVALRPVGSTAFRIGTTVMRYVPGPKDEASPRSSVPRSSRRLVGDRERPAGSPLFAEHELKRRRH